MEVRTGAGLEDEQNGLSPEQPESRIRMENRNTKLNREDILNSPRRASVYPADTFVPKENRGDTLLQVFRPKVVGITDVIARYTNLSTLIERSCTLKFMSSTGVVAAKAPERAIVGPFMTQGGFQYSYIACFPDSIIMVPQGIGS